MAHDADGNTTSRTRISSATASDYLTTYTWDYRNRLTDVDYYNKSSVLTKHVHYVYDVLDNFIGEEDDTTGSGSYNYVERYLVGAFPTTPVAGQPPAEAAQPLLQFDGSGNLTERNLVSLSPAAVEAVIAQELVSSPTSGGPVLWMVDDNLGSPDEVMDDSGNVVDKIKRDSFGNVAHESAPGTAHWAAFAGGHLSAATGLLENDERWLDPATGNWLSQDPIGFTAGDNNLSRYVGNNATDAVDPTGLFGFATAYSFQGGWMTTLTQTVWDNGTYSNDAPMQSFVGNNAPNVGPQWTSMTWSTITPTNAPTTTNLSYTSGRVLLFDPSFQQRIKSSQPPMTALAMVGVAWTAGPLVRGPNMAIGSLNAAKFPWIGMAATTGGTATIGGALWVWANAGGADDPIETLKTEIEELQERVDELQRKIESIDRDSTQQRRGRGISEGYDRTGSENELVQLLREIAGKQQDLGRLTRGGQ